MMRFYLDPAAVRFYLNPAAVLRFYLDLSAVFLQINVAAVLQMYCHLQMHHHLNHIKIIEEQESTKKEIEIETWIEIIEE